MGAHKMTAWQWRAELRAELAPALARRRARDGAIQELPPDAALGRHLAAAVEAPEDQPAVPVSAMDGFAVRAADLSADAPVELVVRGELAAAPQLGPAPTVGPGEALRIMTGAPVPPSTDTVVEVERTDVDPHGALPSRIRIRPDGSVRPGRHVRGIGEEIARGDLLAETGDRIGPGLIALAAKLGIRTLPLARPPQIAVVVTGDEVVDTRSGPVQDIAPGAVRDSNGTMLAAAITVTGGRAELRTTDDDPARLRTLLDTLAEGSDLVLTTGGVGHGAFDVVKAALGDRGAGLSRFEHLRLRPGGPQGYGMHPSGTPMIHLPGTPVGALVGFHLFVAPLLGHGRIERARWDQAGGAEPRPSGRRAWSGLQVLPGRRIEAARGPSQPQVEVVPGRRLAPFGRADCLLLHEEDAASTERAWVPVIDLRA